MSGTAGAAGGGSRQAVGTVWQRRLGGSEVRFVGRCRRLDPDGVLARLGIDLPLAWMRQIHSPRVLDAARGGAVGSGDALVTERPRLALGIAVADCVPLAIVGENRLAVVHAGWRGIVAGVVSAAVDRLGGGAATLRAWIGPAIGPCCYEVGEEVARAVVGASGDGVRVSGSASVPYLDLPRAVELQLRAAGLERIESAGLCTRCHPADLWSYRRDGGRAGRNFLFAWLTGEGVGAGGG